MVVGWKVQKSEVLLTLADAAGAACTDFLSSLLMFEDPSRCGTVLGVAVALCWA